MRKYGWAANPQKLARAIGVVGEESESAIMEEYRKIGGLSFPEYVPVPAGDIALEHVEVIEEPVEKPKKARKVAKK